VLRRRERGTREAAQLWLGARTQGGQRGNTSSET